MNVLNDRKPKETTPEVDLFQVLTLVLFSGAASATFLFAPLPVLIAQWRMPEPWPKVIALLGAIVSIFALEAPVPWAVSAFVLGIVFADSAKKHSNLWRCLAVSVGSALAVSLAVFILHSSRAGSPPLVFWKDLVHGVVGQVQNSFRSGVEMDWGQLESLLYYQSPFLLAALFLMSCWVSLGAAVHFQLLGERAGHLGRSLRKKVRSSVGISVVVGTGYLLAMVLPLPFYVEGVARLLGCLLAIYGSVCLSDVLHRRKVAKGGRTWIYVLSIVFGFYALVALGVVSPWYFRAAKAKDAALKAESLGERKDQ
jgi:nitrate reductase NapE component